MEQIHYQIAINNGYLLAGAFDYVSTATMASSFPTSWEVKAMEITDLQTRLAQATKTSGVKLGVDVIVHIKAFPKADFRACFAEDAIEYMHEQFGRWLVEGARIREMEAENARLRADVEGMRGLLGMME